MGKLAPAIALVLTVSGSALAGFDLSAPGIPGGPAIEPNREACWSQPMEAISIAVSSEVLDWTESRVANDFTFTTDRRITHARWWGQYFNYSSNMPDATTFNLYWYDDPEEDCEPNQVICAVVIPDNAGETLVIPSAVFEYNVDLTLDYCFTANAQYWFVAQCGLHRTLPGAGQWGRKGADGIRLCESSFWDSWYEVWTPIGYLGIPNYDASQEFECADCGATPIQETTWGAIKALYR